MIGLLGSTTDAYAAMLADVAQLSPAPTSLPALLADLGYKAEPAGDGWFARGDAADLVLLFPFYRAARLAIRHHRLVGSHVLRSAAIAAGLAALRASALRPSLLFVEDAAHVPSDIVPAQVVSLQGGVVPRIWRTCFGRLDMLIRLGGRVPHPGQPNSAVNAIEGAFPALHALMQLKVELNERLLDRPQAPDSPLRPRVTISALHGGHSGSVLPSILDVVISRRYDPTESMEDALLEIEEVVRAALPGSMSVEFSVVEHQRPVADPDTGKRSRVERALAAGWGWPQVPFCTSATILPGATLFGGLERPGIDPDSDTASTSLDDMAGLFRSLCALMAGA